MPYISSERVKEIRTAVKKQFPGFKFSIRRHHHSTVIVEILQAPFPMISNPESRYESVNPYHISENYRERNEVREVLEKLHAIMNEGNGTHVEDGDYGTVPRFYTDISIGSYDKPFKVVQDAKETTLQATNAQPDKESTTINPKAIITADNAQALRDNLIAA